MDAASPAGIAKVDGRSALQSLNGSRVALRPYQTRAMSELRTHVRAGRRRCVVILPTGGGKTVLALAMVLGHIAAGGRVLFLAHRDELIRQSAATFIEGGVSSVRIIQADRSSGDLDAAVTVASIPTLGGKRWVDQLPPATLVIFDEAHHTRAKSWERIASAYSNAILIGLTATPERADGKPLGDIFGEIVVVSTVRELTDLGYLVPCSVFAPPEFRSTLADDPADAYLEHGGGRRGIVFCATVAHARDVAERLTAQGTPAACVDGQIPAGTRRAHLQRFAAGELRVVTNCLDTKTEILTRRGWLRHDEMRSDDLTAAYANGRVTWEPISRIVRRPRGEGERMVRVSNQTLDIRVTAGHRMVTRAYGALAWSIKHAGTLPDRTGAYEIPLSGNADADAVTTKAETKAVTALTLDECRFIGLWIADGHIDRKGGRGVEITQSAAYPEANEEIRRILTSCGFDWKHTVSQGKGAPNKQHRYRVPKGNIGGALARCGFAHLEEYLDKDSSPLFAGLSRDQFGALVEGLWLGDGTKFKTRPTVRTRRTSRIANTNKTMIDRMQALAVTRGFACNVFGPFENGPLSTKPIYCIAFRDAGHVTTNNRHVATSGGNPAAFESDWHDEIVWCVTNDTGTIITRRNGKVAILGQCNVLTEGFNDPGAEVCILARTCDHVGLYLQIVGRVLRPAPGKESALLIDLRGVVHRHGLPDDERVYALEGDAIRTVTSLPLKQCKRCGYCGRAWRECPACDFKQADPVPPEVRRERLQQVFATHDDEKRAAYWESLQEIAKARGYHPNWCAHRFRARYGALPARVA